MALSLLVVVLGCGDGDRATPSAGNVGGSGGQQGVPAPIGEYVADERKPPAEDLNWARCPLLRGGESSEAECAWADLPLDWEDAPGGDRIGIFVKRYRVVSRPRGQLWLINGGPGASGADFEGLVRYFLDANPDLVVYLPDHRGTGESARLTCSGERDLYGNPRSQEAAVDTCLAELATAVPAGLTGFSVSGAARDLGVLVDRTRRGAEPVFVYAVSYGTVLAQRYLELFPRQPSGLVLDSICSPGECRFGQRYDDLFDETGFRFLELCREDTDCRTALGGDPRGALRSLESAIETGHCPGLSLTREGLRHLLAEMLRTVGVRELIPAAIVRGLRCSDDDVAALRRLVQWLLGPRMPDPWSSEPLGVNILVSEFMESPVPSDASVDAALASRSFALDVGPPLVRLAGRWPRYASGPVGGVPPENNVPTLMMTGGLDPQTPAVVGQPTVGRFRGEHQTYVYVPTAAHAVLLQSPLGHALSDETCGAALIAQFLADPTGALDTRCVDLVAGIDFDGEPDVVAALFGTADAWLGGALGAQPAPGAPLSRLPRAVATIERRRAVVAGVLPP